MGTKYETTHKYMEYKKFIPGEVNDESSFFVNSSGENCGLVSYYYKKCLNKLGIRCSENNRTPRIHDLRHTFAVNSLASMVDSGLDIYTALPILSTYLGHKELNSTERYVKLTYSRFPNVLSKVDEAFTDVFPKMDV